VSEYRHIDVEQMERVLRAGGERCCYCQRRDYTIDNPKVTVAPTIAGNSPLVAHAKCDEPVQAWRKGRM